MFFAQEMRIQYHFLPFFRQKNGSCFPVKRQGNIHYPYYLCRNMGVVSKIGKNFQEKIWVGYSPTPYHNQPHQNQPFKKVLSHFQPTPTYLNNIIPHPKIAPTKIPTTIEIPTHISLNPKQTPTQNIKTPQNPKIIKRSSKLIINNR